MAFFKCGSVYVTANSNVVLSTASGSIASFETELAMPVKELVCTINPTETGTGAKSPSNPYVIGGHTGINVTQMGKNLFDKSKTIQAYLDSSFRIIDNNTFLSVYVPLKNNVTYHYKQTVTSGAYKRFGLTNDITNGTTVYNPGYPNNIGYIGLTNFTFTNTNNFKYLVCTIWRNTDSITFGEIADSIQLELGSSATTYAPYITPTTHHADFGQRVYGGEFVAKEGEYDTIQPTWSEKIDISTISITKYGEDSSHPYGYFVCRPTSKKRGTHNVISETYVNGTGFLEDKRVFGNGSADNIFYIIDSSFSTANDLKQALAGTHFVCELLTPLDPITLPTKTQVNTLLGANNMYHDCNGNIEVTYRANGALYVAQH